MNRKIIISEQQLKNIVKSVLNEAFETKKLNDLAKEHGGFVKNGWKRSTALASVYTDANIGKVLSPEEISNNLFSYPRVLFFNDGYGVEIIEDKGKGKNDSLDDGDEWDEDEWDCGWDAWPPF